MRYKTHIILAIVLMALTTGFATSPMIAFLQEYLEIKYTGVEFQRFIYVAAKQQKLYLVEGSEIISTYRISTAKEGVGSTHGSFQTPEGLHKIADKIGDGEELNIIIKSKQPTSEKAEIISDASSTNLDLITTRVMHLRGLEEGVNSGDGVDSYSRGIFIHGTHEEGLLGTPASKGCIRMSNKDVVELFDQIEVGTFVVILNN